MGRTAALAFAAGLLIASAPASARTEAWLHNGAEVSWSSYLGWRQVVRVREASLTSVSSAAAPGAVLFSGWRYGNRLYGKARAFRQGCSRPFAYKVRGIVSDDGMRAVLHGLSPVIENCRIVGYRAFGRGATIVLIKAD
ncbi:MAG: hypothetical protein F9K44_15880 [Hyphomicrobiaceae bacterium]|nr:MAG: hypothetical protein F9K44_15880 [Hyphomicrobiaceae bacterium]